PDRRPARRPLLEPRGAPAGDHGPPGPARAIGAGAPSDRRLTAHGEDRDGGPRNRRAHRIHLPDDRDARRDPGLTASLDYGPASAATSAQSARSSATRSTGP